MIDLSNNNPSVDFERVRASGHERVILKLGEGVHFIDPTFAHRRDEAHKAGLKVGAYFFAHPTVDAASQARAFASALPKISKGHDLRPVLDIEIGTPNGKWVAAFCDEFHTRAGLDLCIYTMHWYAEALEVTAAFAKLHPLWLASFGRDDGREHAFIIPKPWRHVAAHQYSDNAHVAGVAGHCDISHVFDTKALDL